MLDLTVVVVAIVLAAYLAFSRLHSRTILFGWATALLVASVHVIWFSPHGA